MEPTNTHEGNNDATDEYCATSNKVLDASDVNLQIPEAVDPEYNELPPYVAFTEIRNMMHNTYFKNKI